MTISYVMGSAGVDRVFVEAGTMVDTTRLGGSRDKVYFTGLWADYTKVVQGSSIRFTRILNGCLEDVLVSAGAGGLDDLLVFTDGNVSSQQAATQLLRSASVGLVAAGGLTGATAEKSSLPTLASAHVLALSADTGVEGDSVTSTPQQTISGSFRGVLRSRDRVQVQVNGVWLDAQVTSNTGSSGSFRLEGVTLQAGSQVLAVRVQDITGRSVLGTGKSVVLDSDAPVATLSVTPTEDAWVNASESGVTVLVGVAGVAGLKAGDAVQLRRAADAHGNTWAGSTVVVTATHLAAGAVRVWVPKSALVDGVNALTARLTDVAGNVGSTEVLQVFLDTQVARPVLSVVPGQDARLNAVEASLDVRVSGGEGPLALREDDWVQLWRGGAALGVAHRVTALEAQANALDLSVQRTALGGNGTYTLTARVWDAAGNVGVSPQALSVVVDTRGPASLLDVSGLDGDTQRPLASGLTDRVLVADEAFVWLRIQGLTVVSDGTLRSGDQVTLLHQVSNQMVALTDAHGQVYRTTVGADGGLAYLKVLKSDLPVSGLQVFQVQVQDVTGNVGLSNKLWVQADTLAPSLSIANAASLSMTGDGNSVGDTVVLNLNFDEDVQGLTSGSVSDIFKVGGGDVSATWSGTHNTNTRTLTYKVLAGQNGQAILDEVALRDALVNQLTDTAGNRFGGTIADIDSTPLPTVDGDGSVIRASAVSVLTKDHASDPKTTNLQQDDTVVVVIDLGEAASGLNGLPTADDGAVIQVAGIAKVARWSTSGNNLLLTYTVASGDSGAITIDEAALKTALNNAGIQDKAGNALVLPVSFDDVDPTTAPLQSVDTTAPTIAAGALSVATQDRAGTAKTANLKQGDQVVLTIALGEAASGLNGLPTGNDSTVVQVASSGQSAAWSTSGNNLLLTYTVGSTDNGAITIDEAKLKTALSSAGIEDKAGNALVLPSSFTDVDATALQSVDGIAPTLDAATAPSLSLTSASVTILRENDTVVLILTFDEIVHGLSSGSDSTIFKVADSGVSATWGGTEGSMVRTLTYKIAAGESGQVTLDETALRSALESGLKDSVGNVFLYPLNEGHIPDIDTGVGTLPTINATPTGGISITGDPTENEPLSADLSALSDPDGLGTTFTYQWLAGDLSISGATSSSYTLTSTEVGKAITVQVHYTDSKGVAEAVTSHATSAVASLSNHRPSGDIVIAGVLEVGKTLSADATGVTDADGLPAIDTYSYQWLTDGTPISGATNNSYKLSTAETGKTISVTVSYTDAQNTAESVTSNATSVVTTLNTLGTLTATSELTQGKILTAVAADTDGLSGQKTWQWLADDMVIADGIESTFTLTQGQVGKAVTVKVTYTDDLGTDESLTHVFTGTVANINDEPTGVIKVAGDPTEGQTLTVDASALVDLDGLGSFFYQWLLDGVEIDGATSDSLVLSAGEIGKNVSVRVTYTDALLTHETLTSEATLSVASASNHRSGGGVTVTGTPAKGSTLTVDASGIIDIDGLGTFSYQWLADGVVIKGAVDTSFKVTRDQIGKAITAKVTYTDALGTEESVVSTATELVANINASPAGVVNISGDTTQYKTLTADASAITDADGLGTFSYQWLADGLDITGATTTSLTLKQAQIGKTISVKVSYSDADGSKENITSAATSAITNVNDAPSGAVSVSGTARQGETLTAVVNLVDVDGLSDLHYEWRADGVAISGSDASTFTLTQAQVGKAMSVRVYYTDGFGTNESLTSLGLANISLGAGNGQLIAPVMVDGNKIYYYWDKSDDGIANDTMAMTDLLTIFNKNSSYNSTGGSVNSTYRYGTLGGVRLAIPTAWTDFGYRTGTATSGSATNTTFDGLPAIWDAFNGAGTDVKVAGVPVNWASSGYYWAAEQSINGAHFQFGLFNGYRGSTMNTNLLNVALELVPASVGYSTPSLIVSNVNDVGLVSLSGSPTQGQTLTAIVNDADGVSGPVSYHWSADGADIAGATSSTFVLTQNQVSKTVTVRVSFVDDTGVSEVSSVTTPSAIANIDDQPQGSATFSGIVQQYQTLSASVALTDLDGLPNASSYSYQWLADGSAISDATNASYKLTQAEVGKRIALQVKYTDLAGYLDTFIGEASASVADVNDPVTGAVSMITTSGKIQVGETVTAVTSNLKDTDGLGLFNYQWMADGVNITGASGATYTPEVADRTKALSVNVSYTDGQGHVESVTSSGLKAISLGTGMGQLISPVSVEGKLYYYWDKNGNGAADSGDTVAFTTLDDYAANSSFTKTPNATVNANSPNFVITVNGTDVRLALPTTTTAFGYLPATSVSGSGNNPTYDGLPAIWDAFNGGDTATSSAISPIAGVPTSWASGYYWASNMSTAGFHFKQGLINGYRGDSADGNILGNYVVFELMGASGLYVPPGTSVI